MTYNDMIPHLRALSQQCLQDRLYEVAALLDEAASELALVGNSPQPKRGYTDRLEQNVSAQSF